MAELGLFNAESRLQDMLSRRRQQMQQQRQQMSQLFGGAANTRRGAAANATAAQVGSGFGQGLARGLFGEGEQIEQAREDVETEQQLQQRIGQLDREDPQSYFKIADELRSNGLLEQGLYFSELGNQVATSKKEQSQLQLQQGAKKLESDAIRAANNRGLSASKNPVEFNEFVAKIVSNSRNPYALDISKEYRQSGADAASETVKLKAGESLYSPFSDEPIIDRPGEGYRAPTQKERADFNLDPSVSYRINTLTGRPEQVGSGGVNITNKMPPQIGNIPKGYKLAYDNNGNPSYMTPIPGGPADREIKAGEESAENQQQLTERQLYPTIDDIRVARELATDKTAGFIPRTGKFAPIVGMVPGLGQPQTDLQSTLQAIESGISLENLNQMRQASPTGGALGNVSDKQSQLLSSAFGTLDAQMSTPLFLYNLARIENTLMDIVHGVGKGPERHDMEEMRKLRRGELPEESTDPNSPPNLDRYLD